MLRSRAALLLLLLAAAASGTARGQSPAPESPTVPAVPASPEPPPATNLIDREHRRVSRFLLDAVDRVDRFLHDSLADEDDRPSRLIQQFYGDRHLRARETAASHLTITPEVIFSEDPTVDARVDFSARVRLRRFSDRLELFADRFDDDEDLLDGVLSRANRHLRDREEEGEAGVRYRLPDYFSTRSSVSAGMAFRPEPVPRLKLRTRIRADPGPWRIRLTESLIWESDDGFGLKTQLEFGRSFGTNTILRFSSGALWSETSRGVDLGQTIVWSRNVSRRRSVSIRAGVAGHTEPYATVDLYSARATWRQRIYRDWLYLEIEPGVDFPREKDFDAVPLLGIRFDVILGAAKPGV